MIRRLFIVLFVLVCSVEAEAQLELKDFKLDPMDLSAVQVKRTYGQDNVCALVKVGLNEPDVVFEGDYIGEPIFKDGEYWLYFPQGATWLNIKTKKYAPLRYDFPEPLESKKTYIMLVLKPVVKDEPTGTLTITSNVRKADVYVDGVKQSNGTPCSYKGGEGKHVVVLKADGYMDATQEIDVKLNHNTAVRINMDAAGSVAVNGISYGIVSVPNVTFQMGSNDFYYEKPIHSVSLRPYGIGKRPVPVALWNQIMGTNDERNNGQNSIVVNVTYEECQDFISLLNQAVNKNFRLPTEAEWEYAVTHKDELGIEDIGNCLEWCGDWFGKYTSTAETSPMGSQTGITKVVRGGNPNVDDSWYARPTYRWHQNPDKPSPMISFRLVCDE